MVSRTDVFARVAILLAIVFGCMDVATSLAADPIGTIRRIQGKAFVQRAGQAQFQPLGENNPIFVQDMIFAPLEEDSKIWWHGSRSFPGDISLGKNSATAFLGAQRQGRASYFATQIAQGIIRFRKKLPDTAPPSSFTVFSPTALVVVVPTDETTDFVVETLDPNRTTVTVLRGEVRVSNIREDLTAERLVFACQTVIVEKDKEPSKVMGTSPDFMKSLIEFTTIPGTLPTDVPSCEPPPITPAYYEYYEPGIIIIPGQTEYYPIPIPIPIPIPPYPHPTIPTVPTAPTMPTTPTMPTSPTMPTFPTIMTVPTRLTFPTLLTVPTRLTFPSLITRPTRFTIPSILTVPTRLTFPTLFTLPTRITVPSLITLQTRFTIPTLMTVPTRRTFPTIRTFEMPTLRTFPTFGTVRTFPSIGTLRTIVTFPTIRTLRTFATIPSVATIQTQPTVPTVRTFTGPVTMPTIPTLMTFPTRFTMPGIITQRTMPQVVPTVTTFRRPPLTTIPKPTLRVPTMKLTPTKPTFGRFTITPEKRFTGPKFREPTTFQPLVTIPRRQMRRFEKEEEEPSPGSRLKRRFQREEVEQAPRLRR